MLALALLLVAAPEPAVVTGIEDKDGIPGAIATFTVDVPADRLLDFVWDGSNSSKIFPEIRGRTELSRTPTSVTLRYELDTILGAWRYRQENVVARLPGGGGSMRWHRLDGDMDVVRGEWLITPLGPDRCSVRYTSYVATGPRLFYGVIKGQQVDNMKDLAERVRAAVAKAP